MSGVLVTGATGFVGSRITSFLEESGVKVRATGRSHQPPPGVSDYRPVDLATVTNLSPLFEGQGAVIHSAGIAHQFQRFPGDEMAFQAVNVEAVERLARAAAAAGVKHFVLLSSVKVYGTPDQTPRVETDRCAPVGPYAVSKFEGEQKLLQVAKETGMSATILRLSPVYGEEDRGNVARLMRAIDRGWFLWVGAGGNLKSLIHRDDVARACACLRSRALPPRHKSTTFLRRRTPCGKSSKDWRQHSEGGFHVGPFLQTLCCG